MTALAFVLLAGAGALVRWLVRSSASTLFGVSLATLSVNLAGALAAGFVVGRGTGAVITAVGVGGLGAATTFSTMVGDMVELTQGGRQRLAAGYVALTVGGGMFLADLGLRLGA